MSVAGFDGGDSTVIAGRVELGHGGLGEVAAVGDLPFVVEIVQDGADEADHAGLESMEATYTARMRPPQNSDRPPRQHQWAGRIPDNLALKIAELVTSGKINGIADIRDDTSAGPPALPGTRVDGCRLT
jgi:hypothetical protein